MAQQSETEPVGFLLAQICKLHHSRARALLKSLGLYRGQPPMLQALDKQEGLTHTELAAHLRRTPATVTRMVQRMEKAGFVKRKPDAEDQRVSRVYLTDAGRAIQTEMVRTLRRLDEEALTDFTSKDQVLLRRLFLQIRDNLTRANEGKPILQIETGSGGS